jgi:hypothetical protein
MSCTRLLRTAHVATRCRGHVTQIGSIFSRSLHCARTTSTSSARVSVSVSALTSTPLNHSLSKPATTTLTIPSLHHQCQRRYFGIGDWVKSKLSDKNEEQQEVSRRENFAAQQRQMLAAPVWTVGEFFRMLKNSAKLTGMDGWRSKMPGVKDNPEFQYMQSMLKVGESLSESESDQTDFVSVRERLLSSGDAKQADLDMAEKAYSSTKIMHGWLHQRHTKNLPLPENEKELQHMMMRHPPKRTNRNEDRSMRRVMTRMRSRRR